MQRILKNQYKRHDIFTCNHSAHQRFGGKISTYYILTEKECYPEGCINFVWRCQLLNKGHACPKKFTHVGRKCFSCKHFYEEKYCRQPKLNVSEDEYRDFLRDREDFDFWIDSLKGREVEIEAEISSVKPDLWKQVRNGRESYKFDGWILVFHKIYINYDLFDDTAFAWISNKTQQRYKFATGDHFEAQARFNFQRGRLVFNRVHRVDMKYKSDSAPPNLNRILVAAETALSFPVQPEKCIHCSEGVLVENMNHEKDKHGRRRYLVCLMGQKNPNDCVHHLVSQIESNK